MTKFSVTKYSTGYGWTIESDNEDEAWALNQRLEERYSNLEGYAPPKQTKKSDEQRLEEAKRARGK